MNWIADVTRTNRANALRYLVKCGDRTMSYLEVIAAWQSDEDFCRWFNALFEAVPYPAFSWETPGVTELTANRGFEFAILDSPWLERPATASVFQTHFARNPQDDVLVFPNLGGDATLVVPRPTLADSAYGHIGAFVRRAPVKQRLGLWHAVGHAMRSRLGERPVWLSTAGGGVAWLHVRLDDQPKYYGSWYRELM